ncbi:MAG: hypothetical protein A2Z25_07340 [Planctomycetes bacterium RBG_16_55_9]|nr:MAG: hypothetical protein A2Z25_07340 [Planctomycetes bacterium RBG_16_55_9]
MQIEEGDIHAFAAELIDLDSMFRKLSVNVRPTIGKAVCLKCIELDILTANVILNNPGSLKKSIELLAQHFTPVAMEQMSLRNAILSEYFLLKDIVSKMPDFNAAGKTPLFKSNSTLRLYRNFYCDWLDAMEGDLSIAKVQLSVWPDIYPFTEPSLSLNNHKPLPLLYKFYNPLVIVVGPRYDAKMLGRHPVTRTQIQDDLFQMILNKRLGREVSLKARAYSDKYIVDVENRKIFSPGPDGEAGTKDDIEMRINPEVLGWGNQE